MESLYLLIPISVVVIAIAVAIFFWAVNSGQYEDIDREGERILFEDEGKKKTAGRSPDSASDKGGDDRG